MIFFISLQEKYCLKVDINKINRAKLKVRSYARIEKGNWGSYEIPILRLKTELGRFYFEFRQHPKEEVVGLIEAMQEVNTGMEVIIKN